jgi:hypothetical protein
LQILQDANCPTLTLGSPTNAFQVAGVVFVGAVRKIQPRDVHAQTKQIAHSGLGMAGGADGADDLGAADGGFRGNALD